MIALSRTLSVALLLLVAACGGKPPPAAPVADPRAAQDLATYRELLNANSLEFAITVGREIQRNHPGTPAAAEVANTLPEIEARFAAANQAKRLAALWDYQTGVQSGGAHRPPRSSAPTLRRRAGALHLPSPCRVGPQRLSLCGWRRLHLPRSLQPPAAFRWRARHALEAGACRRPANRPCLHRRRCRAGGEAAGQQAARNRGRPAQQEPVGRMVFEPGGFVPAKWVELPKP